MVEGVTTIVQGRIVHETSFPRIPFSKVQMSKQTLVQGKFYEFLVGLKITSQTATASKKPAYPSNGQRNAIRNKHQ